TGPSGAPSCFGGAVRVQALVPAAGVDEDVVDVPDAALLRRGHPEAQGDAAPARLLAGALRVELDVLHELPRLLRLVRRGHVDVALRDLGIDHVHLQTRVGPELLLDGEEAE